MRQWIKDLPGDDGWYHTQDGETFERLADTLEAAGVSSTLAEDVLTEAFGAVANEFGM